MAGINNMKEISATVAELAVAIVKNIQDGKFDWSSFVPFLASLPAAIDGMDEIPAEIGDLDSAETKELLETILEKLQQLNIFDPEVAEAGVEAAVSLFLFVKSLLDLIAEVKDSAE